MRYSKVQQQNQIEIQRVTDVTDQKPTPIYVQWCQSYSHKSAYTVQRVNPDVEYSVHRPGTPRITRCAHRFSCRMARTMMTDVTSNQNPQQSPAQNNRIKPIHPQSIPRSERTQIKTLQLISVVATPFVRIYLRFAGAGKSEFSWVNRNRMKENRKGETVGKST